MYCRCTWMICNENQWQHSVTGWLRTKRGYGSFTYRVTNTNNSGWKEIETVLKLARCTEF